ncbi:hypothetical protein AKO1_008405 [Acrasis kona]|uniref:Kinesin light chain n=1 Tax=Acrasis kona TaxID=1008807 RepID=A0AAW2YPP0_9EUKA
MLSPLHYTFKTPPTHPRNSEIVRKNVKNVGEAYRSPKKQNTSKQAPIAKPAHPVIILGENLDDIAGSPVTPTNVNRNRHVQFTPHKTPIISPSNFRTPKRNNNTTLLEMATPTPFKSTGAISAQYKNYVSKPMSQPEEWFQTPSTPLPAEVTERTKPNNSSRRSIKTAKVEYVFVTDKDLFQMELNEQQIKRDEIFRMKTEACQALHNGLFDEAIEKGLECYNVISDHYGPENVDAVYIRLLLGEAYTHAGSFESAMEALTDAEKIMNNSPHCDEYVLYSMLCSSDIGYLHRLQGRLQPALQAYEKVLSMKIKQYGHDSVESATTYNHIGLVLTSLGQFEKALTTLQAALNIRQELLGRNHIETATIHNNIGNVYLYMGHFEQALDQYFMGRNIIEENNLLDHPDLGTCYNNMGTALKELAMYDQAIVMYEKAQNLRERILGTDHSHTAACYLLIGNLYLCSGDLKSALEYMEHALKIRRSICASDGDGEDNLDVAMCCGAIGSVLVKQNKCQEALVHFQRARLINERLLGPEHPDTHQCDENIANCFLLVGKCSDALKLMVKIARHKRRHHGNLHPCTATIYNNIGNVLRLQGRDDEALKMYTRAKDIFESVYGFEHSSTAVLYANLGNLHYVQGKLEEAFKVYTLVYSIRVQVLGKNHFDSIMTMKQIAMVELEMCRYDKAYERMLLARQLLTENVGLNSHPEVAEINKQIALIVRKSGGVGIDKSKMHNTVSQANTLSSTGLSVTANKSIKSSLYESSRTSMRSTLK